CFYRLSSDDAETWSEPKQLTYEEGAPFDPDNPLDPEFIWRNEVYPGNNMIRHSNGTLIWPGAAANVPYENKEGKSYHPWVAADAKSIGSLCFLATWNSEAKDYDWKAGKPVWVPLSVSSRGLMEPEVAEIKDGRVLIIWRGSDTPETQGRKWFSVSEDGGMTLSPVQELKYDDGTRFHSPSSFHRMIRWSVNGRLYWIGNICDAPPSGNSPRYPLIIAEVEEIIPALKRDTVTVIDYRRPEDSPKLQLSNFSLLENRETHTLEIYLTRLGADPGDFWGSDAYRYTLRLVE
ncbi:MAG TPA: exo-alpha-sialidase, partial [Candidatus Hydrogenedentes bacterium]|nr:exo-alpha-sialidase [Candidatus Hydrogenedentota bacterium]